MARTSKQSRRPDTRPAAAGSGPRRLGGQSRPQLSPSAQRRYDRRHTSQSRRIGWLAVGGVIVAIAILLIVNLTSSSKPTTGSTSGVSTGQAPALASATIVDPVTSVPAATFDSIGIADQPAAFSVTKGQPPLTSGGKVEFVYYGAEYCPFCAAMRWSLVAALSRFGTFSNLKQTTSSSTDTYPNIPTFSFLNATYTSPYVTFSPYEYQDRNQNPLQTVPKSVESLYSTYDGTSTGAASKFNSAGSAGIPFLDINNKFVSAGDPAVLSQVAQLLSGGGPGAIGIANALHDPTSSVGKAIKAQYFISEANYISSAICSSNGNKPASVCSSPGVKAATKALAAVKPIG